VRERGHGQRARVGGKDGERVRVGHRGRQQGAGQPPVRGQPRPLPDERQRRRRQSGQVPGADGAEHAELRYQAVVERAGDGLEPGRGGAGTARRELVEPDGERAAGDARRDLPTAASAAWWDAAARSSPPGATVTRAPRRATAPTSAQLSVVPSMITRLSACICEAPSSVRGIERPLCRTGPAGLHISHKNDLNY
jgi:hypothetical protein